MLIGFTGAQCTGKSTLLSKCKIMNSDTTVFNQFVFVEEVTRKVLKTGFDINERGNDITQLHILNQHLVNHTTMDNAILDRCILDGYIYTCWLENNNKVSQWVREYACRLLTLLIENLDVIFYTCPEDVMMRDDGVRSTCDHFRQDIIDLYEDIFGQNYSWLNKVVRLRGSVEDRMETILEKIHESTNIRQQQNKQASRANV